jgi:drug/metabolite transporter (DMT)-like permease
VRLDRTGFALAVLANVIGGATYFATKKALEGLPALSISFVRTAIAVAILVPLAGRAPIRALVAERGRGRGALWAMGILGYALPLSLGNLGVERSTATSGALLIGTEPLCVVLLAALVLGESLTRARIVAIALGLAGATLIVANGIPFVTVVGTPHLAGDLMLAMHGAAWSIWTVAGKRLLERHGSTPVSAVALAISLPVLAVGSALEPGALASGETLWIALAWVVGLGGFVSALGTVVWNAALRRMDASQLAAFIFLQPVVGVVLGFALLSERPTGWALGGGALVFLGVWALSSEGRRE